MNFNGQFGLKDLNQQSDNTQVNNIRRPIQKVKYNYVPMSYSNRIKLANQKYKDDNSLFSGSRLLDRTKELGKVIKTPAATLAASATAVASPTIAARLLTGATSAVGFGELGMGSGNSLHDAAYGMAGEAVAPLVGKIIDKGIGAIKSVGKSSVELLNKSISNFNDINQLYNFAGRNSYRKPLVNPLSSSSVDRAYKKLLDQHNTFVRGVSTSEIALDNPIVLNHLQERGIYDPTISKDLQEEKIANYMSTHIPPDTGNGKYGLGQYENGLYTSKNVNLAKNFAHERGYIATVKRPVDYSSNNRFDWIKSADYKTIPQNAINDPRITLAQELEVKSNNLVDRYLFDLPLNLSKRYPNQNLGSINNLINTKRINKLSELKNKYISKFNSLPPDIKTMSENLNGTPIQEYVFRGNIGDKPVELINLQPINNFKSEIDWGK